MSTTDNALQQCAAQARSIIGLVSALTIEGAARAWLAEKDRERLHALLVEYYEPEDPEQLLGDKESMLEDLLELMHGNRGNFEPDGFEFNEDAAREAINSDPLSVRVRSDWYSLNGDEGDNSPAEFEILLCTGGPAVRIMGEIDSDGEPSRAWLEYQDWGTPWTHYRGTPSATDPGTLENQIEPETLLTYCREFINGDLLNIG
jgi:hypothetical protein